MAILFFSLLIVVIDQSTKLAIKSRFYLGETYDALGSLVRFTFVQNPGIAFGIHFGSAWFYAFFASVASLALLIYIYRMRQSRFTLRLALALIFGGAIGNLIDRFVYGEVIDFIEIGFAHWRWPFIFNIADIGVTIGMIILLGLTLFAKDEQASAPPSSN
jgi:signal peptidase II